MSLSFGGAAASVLVAATLVFVLALVEYIRRLQRLAARAGRRRSARRPIAPPIGTVACGADSPSSAAAPPFELTELPPLELRDGARYSGCATYNAEGCL